MSTKVRSTRSSESYLAAVYLLAEEGTLPTQARLVDRLGHSPAAVSEMVGRLRQAALLAADRQQLILTAAGVARAETSIRRHRLVERLLTDILGVDWTTAHREASRLEQAISQAVEERLIDRLGNPTTSSLGTPIPGSPQGQASARPLLDALPGEDVRIIQLNESLQASHEVIEYLAERGLSPGATMTVDSRTPDGTLTLRSPQATLAVTLPVARQIYIESTTNLDATDQSADSEPPAH